VKIPFTTCLKAALDSRELVNQFDRLNGNQLSAVAKRSPLEILVDQASGYDVEIEAMMQQTSLAFIAFVYEFIYLRLPDMDANG
jgi:hypothetical protein